MSKRNIGNACDAPQADAETANRVFGECSAPDRQGRLFPVLALVGPALRGKTVEVIESRYYNVRGKKIEARFFRKGELFPDTELIVPRQGVWARPESLGWTGAVFVGTSWQSVPMKVDVFYFPDQR